MMDCGYYIDRAVRAAREAGRSDVGSAADLIPRMREEDFPEGCVRDVRYGVRTEEERVDLFFPKERKERMPVLIEVHGGGWYFGQKSSVEFQPFLAGLDRGYIVASAGYTLSPKARFPEAVEEIKGVIRFLRTHAQEYHIDPERIAIWGGSAGAQLAGLAAMDAKGRYDAEGFGDLKVSAKVNACVLWYGCYDYFTDGRQREELGIAMREGDYWTYRNYLGKDELSECGEALREMNPENHITAEAPPVYFQHGDRDSYVPYIQSVSFCRKLRERLGENAARLEILPGYEHADDRMFERNNVEKVFDFISQY